MKTQRSMKTRRSVFSLIVLSLLVGIGGLLWSSTSAQAATVDSTLQISVAGSITEPDGTVVSVGGWVTVNSTMVTDADGTSPRVVLAFDFSNVYGSSGRGHNLVVYVTGGDQDVKIRPLQATDVIPITCPYYDTNAGILSADTWLVTTTLNFDITTGVLTSGSTAVSTNPYLGL
jgi:hypothetical protein